MPKKFLEAGKIVGTHGIRGDLKVQSWCDTPEVLCDFDTLYLDEKTPVEVTSAQVHKNVVLMHLKGVDTVEAAEKLRGKILHLDRDDVDLPEDLVFIQDILTFKVYDLRVDRVIGHIRDVLTSNPAVADVGRLDLDESLVLRPADNALAHDRVYHLGEQRHDVDFHSIRPSMLST